MDDETKMKGIKVGTHWLGIGYLVGADTNWGVGNIVTDIITLPMAILGKIPIPADVNNLVAIGANPYFINLLHIPVAIALGLLVVVGGNKIKEYTR